MHIQIHINIMAGRERELLSMAERKAYKRSYTQFVCNAGRLNILCEY